MLQKHPRYSVTHNTKDVCSVRLKSTGSYLQIEEQKITLTKTDAPLVHCGEARSDMTLRFSLSIFYPK